MLPTPINRVLYTFGVEIIGFVYIFPCNKVIETFFFTTFYICFLPAKVAIRFAYALIYLKLHSWDYTGYVVI